MRKVRRSGWGLEKSTSTLLGEIDEFTPQVPAASGLAVGLGRSYGDSALNSEGVSWSVLERRSIKVDAQSGVADVEAGATIGELERAALPHGLFPPVVPGTEFVTIGGAIAADIHGKSHHKYGTFSSHVMEFKLMDSNGKIHVLTPQGKLKDWFYATAGGMGLTGLILSARIKLISVETAYFKVEEKRARNLTELVRILEQFDDDFDYTVAWIDFSGDYRGRGVVTGGNHCGINDLSVRQTRKPLSIIKPSRFSLPNIFPSTTINWVTVRLFNALWYHKPLSTKNVHATKFLHPLDPLQNWNRVYGRRGFLQYQFVIPLDCIEFVSEVLTEMKKIKAPSFLSVLKKFDAAERPYLSFPKPGWTLAIDVPLRTEGLLASLEKLDVRLTSLGGKIYLAKDSRLSIANFRKMYPDYVNWVSIKSEMDPDNYWQSDQGRRLGLS